MQLVLNSYGCRLSRHKGRFRVQCEEKDRLISPHKVQSILLPSAASLTTGAVLLALKHQIPIVFLEASGQPAGRLWHSGFGSIATIRREQVHFAQSVAATHWMISQFERKTLNQEALILKLSQRKATAQKLGQACITYLRQQQEKMTALTDQPLSSVAASLRGLEGSVSRQYFRTLSELLPARYRFAGRSRRPATDAFNASLNYAYGMLYGQVETSLIAAGLDPSLPLFHADAYGKPAFVYDFIEAYRPWADEVVIGLCLDKSLKQLHLKVLDSGVWLNREGRALLIPAYHTAMSQRLSRQDRMVQRTEYIRQEAHSFALKLLRP